MIVTAVHKSLKALSRILAWETERLYKKSQKLISEQAKVKKQLGSKEAYYHELIIEARIVAEDAVNQLVTAERAAYSKANEAYNHIMILNRITEEAK